MPRTDEEKKKLILDTIVEGRKMEAYAEHRTREMHSCAVCDTVCYKKKSAKKIGKKYVCIDCLRNLKEVLDSLSQWEEEILLEGEMKKQLEDGLNL